MEHQDRVVAIDKLNFIAKKFHFCWNNKNSIELDAYLGDLNVSIFYPSFSKDSTPNHLTKINLYIMFCETKYFLFTEYYRVANEKLKNDTNNNRNVECSGILLYGSAPKHSFGEQQSGWTYLLICYADLNNFFLRECCLHLEKMHEDHVFNVLWEHDTI